MSEALMPETKGSFWLSTTIAGTTHKLRVFYHRPASGVADAPLVIAMHGMTRDAADLRDAMAMQASRNFQIILVPEFDKARFPDHHAYNFGNVCSAPPDRRVHSRDHWNFCIIDQVFEFVRASIPSRRTTFGLYGNSAGSQYVMRYLALTSSSAVDMAVASNAGAYMLPELNIDYPAGMGGIGLNEADRNAFLERRLVLLIGEADVDASASDLPRGDFAMAQGPHRLARAEWYFAYCSSLADRLGLRLGWRLERVAGAGHISQLVFDRAANILRP